MPIQRLPDTVQTLYAELLDQTFQAEAERLARGLPPGTFVSKEIKGRRYWYLQTSTGSEKTQRYLGPETPALRDWMARTAAARTELAADEAARARLVAMLIQGGAARVLPSQTRVLTLLADLGVFVRGGALVGTQAFAAYGNLLGVRFDHQNLATQDVNVAQDLAIAFALGQEPPARVAQALTDPAMGFLPVPALDHRLPSTSFNVRGREIRVDFLAPARRRGDTVPVGVPGLGVFAQPLPFLDYLLEETVPAALLAGAGIAVRLPTPARFALHKVWLSRQRPASEQARARKDLRQALALLEVLQADRPGDLLLAWDGLARRKSARRVIEAALEREAPQFLPR
ncbi:MAG TPA: GSU2403 family nucleotidyltransferase fold protein [Thermoanaerobaculia bacterium]|nr:GSU2403 family nucleotidyltransferase fold protein [Thermoanaerobaculia bacterium]